MVKEPQTRTKHIDGVQGHVGVIWGQIHLGMPYGNQIWSEESQTRAKQIDGVKGHAGVIQGQIPIGESNLVIRTPDQQMGSKGVEISKLVI